MGADVVFEAAGVANSAVQMVNMVRIKGEIILVVAHKEPHSVDLFQSMLKEIVLKGTRVYTHLDYQKAIELLSLEKINIQPLISHRFNLEDAKVAFELMKKADRSMKILLRT